MRQKVTVKYQTRHVLTLFCAIIGLRQTQEKNMAAELEDSLHENNAAIRMVGLLLNCL